MKTIMSDEYSHELKRLGVNPLSGEGCQLGTRLDTDVCLDTVPLVESYLGGVTISHSGFNGWARDPEGVWHPSASRAWDYENKCKREGWITDQGKCFKLPRTMIDELLVYLLLNKDDKAEVIVWKQGKHGDEFYINGLLLVMSKEEWNLFKLGYSGESTGEESGAYDQGDRMKRQEERFKIKWRVFFQDQRGSNTHGWTGKNIS